MPKILVADDEQGIREMLEIYLQRESFEVTCAPDGEAALSLCRKTPFDVVIADIKMPRMDGISLLHAVREFSPDTIFIMITAFGSFETAKESMHENAYDYITKPFNVEDIKAKIDAALKQRQEAAVPLTDGSSEEMENRGETCYDMIGQSKEMKKIFDLIQRAASSKSTVLITGESGTGKELVARAIHYHSNRVDNPFVVINCGGIPDTLLESELFGYKKGAFTGAMKDKKGFLEVAQWGTLFLDEVGELPLSLQVKLLRAVQDKSFTPVGGTDEVQVDVRIISATNKDLEEKVVDGTFREDLYYRLNVIHVAIPPLRERKEDIPLLADFFLKKYTQEMQKDITSISSYALDFLMNYAFPGNVRELENIIERGVALAKTSIMLPESIGLAQRKTAGDQEAPSNGVCEIRVPEEGVALDNLVAAYEKSYIEEALSRAGGSITGAAKLLNITFRSMRYRLQKLEIDEKQFKK